MSDVVAALIWRDNTFFIAQRPAGKKRALLWEFVGGKVEPGESHEEALVRECMEELGVTVEVGDLFMHVVHEYPDVTVPLYLYNCKIVGGEPKLIEHNAHAWITSGEIDRYDFCPADGAILEKIKAEFPAVCSQDFISEAEGRGIASSDSSGNAEPCMTGLPVGKYRHFKGMEYEVIAVARHSETLEEMVVYRALYGDGGVWVRPLSMWNETVERDGAVYKRFEFVGE